MPDSLDETLQKKIQLRRSVTAPGNSGGSRCIEPAHLGRNSGLAAVRPCPNRDDLSRYRQRSPHPPLPARIVAIGKKCSGAVLRCPRASTVLLDKYGRVDPGTWQISEPKPEWRKRRAACKCGRIGFDPCARRGL